MGDNSEKNTPNFNRGSGLIILKRTHPISIVGGGAGGD